MWSRNCLPFQSTWVFSRVRVSHSSVFCVMFCRSLFVFGHCVVCDLRLDYLPLVSSSFSYMKAIVSGFSTSSVTHGWLRYVPLWVTDDGFSIIIFSSFNNKIAVAHMFLLDEQIIKDMIWPVILVFIVHNPLGIAIRSFPLIILICKEIP
jgi:hypothetical protein